MSFILKLFSHKSSSKSKQQACPVNIVYTQEDGEFVNICHSRTYEPEDEEAADISKWEMAKILGRGQNTIVSRTAGGSSIEGKVQDSLKKLRNKPSSSQELANRAKPLEKTYCIEDSTELDMFDDKRNRILKRSNRRKLNFSSKAKI